ncbi:long-chain-fatty-acid--CoA ligase [Carboxydothermus ferrireducens]|uniref:Long-chain acyl-CoA synthetase n=1 Tax=Carboxydothermus ferrireducens DSM 11255 TaxID=1119529 RepID=A0ABX2R9X9_9THEO|nr:long-chain fatty acid--CoA ligase [Carboxydothermus ferrireducens]NYE57855.1 long-chain acyl-CoA synthetase [Carboxydothermus ferrireducens DSM 11255]
MGEPIWLKSYEEGVPHSLNYPDKTIAQIVDEIAAKMPNHKALIFYQKEITYGELKLYTDLLAAALARDGVKKGDRVALMSPNTPQYVITYLAVQKIGAILVQVNPMYVERELLHILNDSGAKVIVAMRNLYPRIKAVQNQTNLEKIILFDFSPYDVPDDAVDFEAYVKSAAGYTVEYPPIDYLNDPAVLQYTGGTTGIAKGAILTNRNILANPMQVTAWMTSCEFGKEVVLGVLPFFHSYGMSVAMNFSLINAGTLVLLPRFEINEVMNTIKKYRPTVFPGVPTMYIAINNYPNAGSYGIDSIKECISGSAPLPVEVALKFEELTGGHLVEGYGLSEASPVTHCNPLGGKRKVGSIGLPFPDTEAKIVDPENYERELPIGEIGELAVKGPQVMKGYWNMPEETARVLKDGWLYTGDIARMDEDGYFYIVDRKKDMIIASGYNIYPREVEEVLFEHPKIKEAVVVGVPDEYRGETVKAFVVLKDGETATAEEIIAFCKERLAAYKVPKKVEFREELPKTAVGKILRRQLREEELGRK